MARARHVGRLAVQVHRQHGAVRGVMAASTAAGSSVSRVGVDVGEHRPRAGHHHGERGVGGRERRS
jgi:hypothetical protein